MACETKADFRFERLSRCLNACASQGAQLRTKDENEDENSAKVQGAGVDGGGEGYRLKFDRLHLDSCQASWRALDVICNVSCGTSWQQLQLLLLWPQATVGNC